MAYNKRKTTIEFAKDNKEIIFTNYEEAKQFINRVKQEHRWAASYKFSIMKSE
ncbi:hypothetical protein [Halobacillus seohaensis]|uniref:Phage protein n=1 Tax=Halobacillus seohaensis TaxID=447421 RepID=A0ABW2ER32_9BACI